jgi:GH35 family endo-1,4-beta-xylanase
MKRRDFMKMSGLGAASLVVQALPSCSANNDSSFILSGVEERINRHRKGDALLRLTGPDGKPLANNIDVKIEQTRHKFLFGCNIFKLHKCRTPDDNTAYEKHFDGLLNFATLPFYWWNYERQKGEPDDQRTEEIIRWCKSHGITMKGHPLAWNYVDPRWLRDDPERAMELQLRRIVRCVRRFKGDIDIWDVVNEATHYDREQIKKQAPILTEAITAMGVDKYVREAFKEARRANPGATLLINDYRTDPAYAQQIISKLVNDQGKPLYDVIGIQSHMHGGKWKGQKTWEVCERFARFGQPLHFTETTLISGKQGWDLRKSRQDPGFRWASTSEGEKRQANDVIEFYSILFSHPAVEAITWWDFTDQNSWQGAPAGLLRDDMTPKPAYEELKRLIKGKWWTKTQAAAAPGGRVEFRGFFGDYSVTSLVDGRTLHGTFRFHKGQRKAMEVRMEA